MPTHITPYVMIGFISTLLNAAVAFVAWNRRRQPGSWSLTGLMCSVTIWSAMATFQYASSNLVNNIFWAKMLYWGIVQTPVWYLYFAFEFSGLQRWITLKNTFRLSIVPVISLVLVWTNDLHGLVWSGYTLMADGFSYHYAKGPALLFLIAGYSYVLMALGSYFLIRTMMGLPKVFRKQINLIIAGIAAPWIFNILYLSGLGPLPIDPTPLVMSLTGIFFLLAMLQYQLLEIVPIARHTVIETLPDGVIVLDAFGRLADINPEARNMLKCSAVFSIGAVLWQDLASIPELQTLIRDQDRLSKSINVVRGCEDQSLSVHISPIFTSHKEESKIFIGHIVTLRNVTELIDTQEVLTRTNTNLKLQLDENERLRGQLAEMAIHDPLTGLHNRRYLDEACGRELSRAIRGKYELSIFIIDIDYFKQVNDTYGHLLGDQVLISLSQFLTSTARAGDIVCRYGGEEFLLVMPGLNKDDCVARAQLICDDVRTLEVLGKTNKLRISVSIGGAVFPHHGITTEDLIREADTRLYDAKHNGRAQVVVGPT